MYVGRARSLWSECSVRCVCRGGENEQVDREGVHAGWGGVVVGARPAGSSSGLSSRSCSLRTARTSTVLAAKTVETHGKGSVLAAKTVETHKAKAVS